MWSLNLASVILLLSVILVTGNPTSRTADPSNQDSVYDAFKYNLIRYFGVSEDFAEQFKVNLKRAITSEMKLANLRQGNLDEEEEEDETEKPTTTTEGPGAFGIINGIYGIIKGIGTLNPDSIFQSTVNFFPPSQRETAQTLLDSAVGKPVKFPTPTTTKLTTTTPTTTTKDEDYDEDEDETTAAVLAATAVPTTAAPVAGSTNLAKYTIRPKDPSVAGSQASSEAVQAQPVPAATPSGSLIVTTPQDDELDTENKRYVG